MRTTLLTLALFAFPALLSAASVPVELAYRNPTASTESDRRTVMIQAQREGQGDGFATACGAMGAKCECLFFLGEGEPLRGTSLGVSAPNRSLSCTIPGGQSTPDLVRFAAVRLRSGEMLTGRIPVRTTLSLEDVIGRLPKEKVRGVFRYSCERTFFEGEGVSASQISCVPHQHLGVISARYHFYTYRSGEDAIFPGGDAAFPAPICGRSNFLRLQCTGNPPELRFGLYKENVGPFAVGMQMTRAPECEDLTRNYGYAALPDSSGLCPLGLVKARPWVARPVTMSDLPSNFVNEAGSLNDTVVEVNKPAAFGESRGERHRLQQPG